VDDYALTIVGHDSVNCKYELINDMYVVPQLSANLLEIPQNIGTNLTSVCDLETITLSLKTHIFVFKIPISTLESKSGATGSTLFSPGIKLQFFVIMTLKTHIVANNNLKISS
jgi:hypothetical protein